MLSVLTICNDNLLLLPIPKLTRIAQPFSTTIATGAWHSPVRDTVLSCSRTQAWSRLGLTGLTLRIGACDGWDPTTRQRISWWPVARSRTEIKGSGERLYKDTVDVETETMFLFCSRTSQSSPLVRSQYHVSESTLFEHLGRLAFRERISRANDIK